MNKYGWMFWRKEWTVLLFLAFAGRAVGSSSLRNVQSVQMHRGPPHFWGPPHLTYHAQKKIDYEKL